MKEEHISEEEKQKFSTIKPTEGPESKELSTIEPETENIFQQETLEEAAYKYSEPYRCPATNTNEYCKHDIISAFINGAKWQQEKSYSEEDMKSFGDWCRNGLLNTEYGVEKLDEHLEQWKQFKKK
jgi:hypothetical protein